MRFLYLQILLLLSSGLCAQSKWPRENIELLARIHPNADSVFNIANKYSGCWGWHQVSKNKEYALVGGTNGTYFVDITNPSNPVVCDFVFAKNRCVWRELKTYRNYCYVVTECSNGLQIIDMQYLPDSVHVVSSGTLHLVNSHAIWVEGNKLYSAQTTIAPGNTAGMAVFSLLNPEQPALLRKVNADYSFISAHDMFVRGDTAFVSAGNSGMYILKYDSLQNKFLMLGSYSGYSQAGYNHSSWLTQNGKYLLFCDENPGVVAHIVDVSNLQNITAVSEFKPYPNTLLHNPFVIGNNWAVISCNDDGLHVYDISNPFSPRHAGFFDTCPQSGYHQGVFSGGGSWGAYPYLPSGNIITTDRRNGVFLLDASQAYNSVVGIEEVESGESHWLQIKQSENYLMIHAKGQKDGRISLSDLQGKVLFEKKFESDLNEIINTENYTTGVYVIGVEGERSVFKKKVVLSK